MTVGTMLQELKGIDIVELPPYNHAQAGKRHRKHLIYAAHAARWTANVYFFARLALLLSAVQQSWQAWLMVTVEWISACMFPAFTRFS